MNASANVASDLSKPDAATQRIQELAAAIEPHIIELRRAFHEHPELSGHEEWTADAVCSELENHMLDSVYNYHAQQIPNDILFLDEKEGVSHQDCLYIATRASIEPYLNKPVLLSRCYLFFPKGRKPSHQELALFQTTSIFFTDLEVPQLYNLLHQALERLGSASGTFQGKAAQSFNAFLSDVMNQKITREDEIRARITQLPNMQRNPSCLIVLEPEDPDCFNDIYSSVADALGQIFRYSNTTAYFTQIVTLAQMPTSTHTGVYLPAEMREKLDAVCKRFNCVCAISNVTNLFSMIRSNYLNACDILSLGKIIRNDPNEKIFDSERYYVYLILHTYYKAYTGLRPSEDFSQSLQPGVAALIEYDHEHDTELRKLMCCYLLCERNYALTATRFRMHRNTVVYKMRRAVEIMNEDLEDPMTRTSILISCLACELFELTHHTSL